MTHLRISLLGPMQIFLDEEPVTAITSPKIEALLAYLVAESDRAHSREALADLLWPGSETGRQNLRKSLSRLQQALPPPAGAAPFFRVTRQAIGFNRTSRHHLDLAQFIAGLDRVRRHDHPNLLQCRACYATLLATTDHYGGDFLEGLMAGSAPFEEWALLKREWLRQEMLWTLDVMAQHLMGQNEFQDAHTYARRQIEIDPLREEAHRQVMQVLAADGRRNAALAHYERLVDLLRAELGVVPALETTALVERIRTGALHKATERQGFVPSGPKASPLHPPTAAPLHNLPPQFTPFVGRQADLRQIHDHLDRPECRLLSLVGPGGVGKSRLAIQAVVERRDQYRDGVWFVPLAALSAADQIVDAVAGAVNVRFGSGTVTQAARRAELLADLRGRRLFLVLDNVEHLLPGADAGPETTALDLILAILDEAPHVDLLATSRQPLHLRAEWICDVTGLPYPQHATDETDLPQHGAIQLFVQSAQRLRADWALTPANHTEVQRICRLVEGVPLALELAAASVRALSCAEIAGRIENNLDFLTTSMHDVPARHSSLRAVFDHSWKLLDSEQRTLFPRLSVFRGAFSAQAALAVAAVPTEILHAFTHRSLLRKGGADHERERFELHETLRQYAAERLAADPGDAQTTRERHAHYYTRFLAQQQAGLDGADLPRAAAAIHAELDNVRMAWSWAVTQTDTDALARGLHGLLRYYVLTNLAEEGERAFGAAVVALRTALEAEAQPHPVRMAVLADLMAAQARMRFKLAGYAAAAQLAAQAATLAEQVHARRPAALAYLYQGIALLFQGQLDEARSSFGASLGLARAIGWRKIEADALRAYGILHEQQQDWTRAEHYYRASLQISQAIEDLRGASASLGNLGVIQRRHGKMREARAYLEQALAIHETIGDGSSAGRTLTYLGELAIDQAAWAEAERYLVRACDTLQTVRDRHHEANARVCLALVHRQLARPAAAVHCLERALSLYRAVGDPTKAAEVEQRLASVNLWPVQTASPE